jgi:hypothetical protein
MAAITSELKFKTLSVLADYEGPLLLVLCFLNSAEITRVVRISLERELRSKFQGWAELWRAPFSEQPALKAFSITPSDIALASRSSEMKGLSLECNELMAKHRIAHSVSALRTVRWTSRTETNHRPPRAQEGHSAVMLEDEG